MIVGFAFLLASLQSPPPSDAPRIVARVDKEIILSDEIDRKIKGISGVNEAIRRGILRQLAGELLLQQEVRRHDIKVTEDEISDAVEKETKSLGGPEKLAAYLRSRQMTSTEFREEQRKDLLVRRLYRQMAVSGLYDKASFVLVEELAPETIREYYEKNRERFKGFSRVSAWRIGLTWKTEPEKSLRHRLAESLRRRLKEGYDFELLARFYSDVWTTSARGERTHLVQDLGRTNDLFSASTTTLLFDVLQEKEVSPVVEDGNTLNLFQVVSRQELKEMPFEEAQVYIFKELRSEQVNRNQRLILSHLARKVDYWPEDLFRDLLASP